MAKDQVEISFGPARYDSPKAIRRQIEEAKIETEENTINNIVNNPALDLGGGGAGTKSRVTVDSYDPVTGAGTGTDEDGNTYDFTNGTGVFLVPDDVVFLIEDGEGNWTAVGVTERSGQVTPVDQPIAVVDTGFPLLVGSGLSFPIRPDFNSTAGGVSNSVAYDMAGLFGLGADAIIGANAASSATAVNAFIRSSATNVSLFTTPVTQNANRFYIQPNGRLVNLTFENRNMYYRLPGAGSWTSAAVSGTVTWAIDYQTGAMWGASNSGTSPYAHTIWRFLPTDAAPVNMGQLGTPNSNLGGNLPLIAAGHGFVTMSVITSGTTTRTYCVKPSNDSSNFTQLGTFSTASWLPSTDQTYRLQVDQSGATSYLVFTGTTLRIRSLTQSLVVFDYNTGIPAYATYGFNHKHLASGIVAIICAVRQDVLGGASTTLYSPVLSTYNYSTTSYQYYDLALFAGSSATLARFGAIDEVVAGTIRFTMSDTTESSTRVIELSGL
jgi:hypothetical protein